MTSRARPDRRVKQVIGEIIDRYNATLRDGALVEHADSVAQSGRRATGGVKRANKGKLVEDIGRRLVEAAWIEKGYPQSDLVFSPQKYPIPVREDYMARLLEKADSSEARDAINKVLAKGYPLNQDISVYREDEFVLSIECKAYAENAMLKRVVVDAWLMKQALTEQFPRLNFALIQLENHMGGDYGDVSKPRKVGSPQSHVIMSYFGVNLHIITLLEGKRKSNQPIHEAEYFKPLSENSLMIAVRQIQSLI